MTEYGPIEVTSTGPDRHQQRIDAMAPRLLASRIENDDLRKRLRRAWLFNYLLLFALVALSFAWLLIPC